MNISVVIPCYNAAEWLPDTITKIVSALDTAKIRDAEIIVVDDGSTDGSSEVARSLKFKYPIVMIEQANTGRFLARKAGVLKAHYENILFIDTRVHLDIGSVAFLVEQQAKHPERRIWNGHVNVAKKGNMIARFMDAVTFIGWRRYFAHPRTTSYGLKDFDYYPKGTGCFFVPKDALLGAIKEFETTTTDLRFSSDDTLMIRILARSERINLSPEFACTYYARTSIQQFIKHSYYRGQYFVDGFLRKGTRFYYPIILFLSMPLLALIVGLVSPKALLALLTVLCILWLLEPLVALMLGVTLKDTLSLFTVTPIFSIVYGLGIWRAVIRKIRP